MGLVDRALGFYTGTLGLEKGMDEEFGDGDRFVTVAPGGPDRPDDRNRLRKRRSPGHGGRAEGEGVQFIQEPEEQEWGGVMGLFADPDGNQFVIHSRQ